MKKMKTIRIILWFVAAFSFVYLNIVPIAKWHSRQERTSSVSISGDVWRKNNEEFLSMSKQMIERADSIQYDSYAYFRDLLTIRIWEKTHKQVALNTPMFTLQRKYSEYLQHFSNEEYKEQRYRAEKRLWKESNGLEKEVLKEISMFYPYKEVESLDWSSILAWILRLYLLNMIWAFLVFVRWRVREYERCFDIFESPERRKVFQFRTLSFFLSLLIYPVVMIRWLRATEQIRASLKKEDVLKPLSSEFESMVTEFALGFFSAKEFKDSLRQNGLVRQRSFVVAMVVTLLLIIVPGVIFASSQVDHRAELKKVMVQEVLDIGSEDGASVTHYVSIDFSMVLPEVPDIVPELRPRKLIICYRAEKPQTVFKTIDHVPELWLLFVSLIIFISNQKYFQT